jgi:hypothetical protein
MGPKHYTKIVDERFILPEEKGGGLIKFEVWEWEGKIVKYSMAYINRNLFTGDNGRVLGYDNTHAYHHRHYFGEIFPVDDFESYEALVSRFEEEVKELLA